MEHVDRVKEIIENSVLEYVQQKDTDWEKKKGYKKGEYHVTSLPKCIRQQFFMRKIPRKYAPEEKLKFETGNAFHDHAYKVLSKYIVDTEQEVRIPVNKEITIVGRYDALCRFNGTRFLVDVKSTDFLEYPKKYGVSDQYIDQLNAYMSALKLDKGYVWYIEKNTYNNTAFKIDFDEKRIERIKNKAICLHEAIKSNKMPEPDNKDWECKMCLWRDLCKK